MQTSSLSPTSSANHPDRLRIILNILALVVTVTVNALANILPLNGQLTGEISDRFDVYFVPAGYVFSIWGLIYLAMGAFIVYQALPAHRADPALRKISGWFILSCAANAIWIFFWHFNLFPLSLLVTLTLLAALIAIYLTLDIGQTSPTPAEKWFVHIPFSIYLGWTTVATIANATALLDYWQWNRWGLTEEVWYWIILAAAVAISAAVSLLRRDLAFTLVIVWALVGIAIKHAATMAVANATWLAVGVVILVYVVSVFRARARH